MDKTAFPVPPVDKAVFGVPLDGYTMQLRLPELESVAAGLRLPELDSVTAGPRLPELESVAAGLGEFDSSAEDEFDSAAEGALVTLAEALRRLPTTDRAPAWELAVRRYGRHKPLPQAAGEIGLDVIAAGDLLERFAHNLTAAPPPELPTPPPFL